MDAVNDDFSPGSAWQTEAELNGASCMADAGGNLVPYASLMKRAAMHLSAIRAENAQLRKALESIAAVAGDIPDSWSDNGAGAGGEGHGDLTSDG